MEKNSVYIYVKLILYVFLLFTYFCFRNCCKKQIENCRNIAAGCLAEGLRNTPSEILQEFTLLQFAANALLDNTVDNLVSVLV